MPAPPVISAAHTSATLPEAGGEDLQQPESHYIGTPATSLLGPVQYVGTPVPSSPLPPPANPKRFCPQLCPGLVVPRGSECVLAMQPLAPGRGPRESCKVEVLDLRGKHVLRAAVGRPLLWPQTDGDSALPPFSTKRAPAVTLRMLQPASTPALAAAANSQGRLYDSSVLSVCREGLGPEGRQMSVFDANGRLFGALAKDPTRPRYILSSSRGEGAVHFDGLFSSHTVVVANDQQEQLADAEPCSMAFNPQGKFVRLRVSSGVDVGLVLVGLVCIGEMEEPPVEGRCPQ